jgi:hypothetical protein
MGSSLVYRPGEPGAVGITSGFKFFIHGRIFVDFGVNDGAMNI